MELGAGRLISVNVGELREIELKGKPTKTGIYKHPVGGRRRAFDEHLEGDTIGNPEVHGSADKAIYAYAASDYRWWERQLGRELVPGSFGENLTVEGIDVSGAIVGEGELGRGDAIEVIGRPAHGVSVRTMGELILGDHSRAAEIAATPEAPVAWRDWAGSRALDPDPG